jgi:hypothetical protein
MAKDLMDALGPEPRRPSPMMPADALELNVSKWHYPELAAESV